MSYQPEKTQTSNGILRTVDKNHRVPLPKEVNAFNMVDFRGIAKLYNKQLPKNFGDYYDTLPSKKRADVKINDRTTIGKWFSKKTTVETFTCNRVLPEQKFLYLIRKDNKGITEFGKKIMNRINHITGQSELYMDRTGNIYLKKRAHTNYCDSYRRVDNKICKKCEYYEHGAYNHDECNLPKSHIDLRLQPMTKYVMDNYRNDIAYILWENFFYYKATPELLIRYYDRFDEEAISVMKDIFRTNTYTSTFVNLSSGWFW